MYSVLFGRSAAQAGRPFFCPLGWPLIRSFLHVEQGNDHFGDVSKMVVRINTLIIFLMSGT